MSPHRTKSNPLFAGRWFDDEVILLSLRWYFRFKLSYRDLVEILSERGLVIAHSTILRWVICYAALCEERWRANPRRTLGRKEISSRPPFCRAPGSASRDSPSFTACHPSLVVVTKHLVSSWDSFVLEA